MLSRAWRNSLHGAAAMVFVIVGPGTVRAGEAAVAARDALVYRDGDRVQGKLVEQVDNIIVFKTDRFGEVRVAAEDATVILAGGLAVRGGSAGKAPVVAGVLTGAESTSKKAVDHGDEDHEIPLWARFSPWLLTARLKEYFGPWHGRFAFSTEIVSDVSDRNNVALDGTLRRKWKSDEVQLTARYDYSSTNQVDTTDVLKAAVSYRHDFSSARFALYRPSVEWNRAGVRKVGIANDYVLLQQEIGVGFNLLSKPGLKLRAGVSENIFDLWNSPPLNGHSSRAVESFFEETEITLPWKITLAQRGVYYPFSGSPVGWENRIELNKKLTETLSVAVRHEIRRNNPDGSSLDYTRLKLLLGLDF